MKGRAVCLLAAAAFLGGDRLPAADAAGPAPGATDVAGFRAFDLRTGRLYLPTEVWAPTGRVDLLIHFHGHPPVVCSNLLSAGKVAPVVIVNFKGLSAAYAEPFRDPSRLDNLLRDAREQLVAFYGRPLEWGHLALSSFSAGYGAVREILKQPEHGRRISDLVLADSLYAGYVKRANQKVPDPEQMKEFARFAQRAAQGEVRFIVTHSQQVPGTYASTRETADALLEAAHLTRTVVTGRDDSGMLLESRVDWAGFHLRSYAGTNAEAHLQHLRSLGAALRLTALPEGAADRR